MRWTTRVVMIPALLVLPYSIGLGQSASGPPDRVEEDWQVVIASADPAKVGPQLTTCMSPVTDGSAPFVAFDLNYRDSTSFRAGGLQLNVYSNGTVADSSSQGDELFETANETITWTQRMSLSGSAITYAIINGQSTTWGQFGQAQELDSVSFDTSVTSLTAYSPDSSVAKSGAGWQSNRVNTMALVCVRYYRSGQLISTDNNVRSVNLSGGTDQ